ncbi:MAG: hypothetical protein JXR84_00540 [Anaerolineae bacterium]|jgi:hypothetical protein|nr:hypothetical protein [Anaerolineae bacterium]
MQTLAVVKPREYAHIIAKLVAQMPPERAAEVYDFVLFLLARPTPTPVETEEDMDWLNDDEAQMQAEDALWEAAYAQHHEKLMTLAEVARAEIADGRTQPMFNERGEFDLK